MEEKDRVEKFVDRFSIRYGDLRAEAFSPHAAYQFALADCLEASPLSDEEKARATGSVRTDMGNSHEGRATKHAA